MLCKSTAVWTLFVFVIGWIAGSLFFVSYMALNDYDLSSTTKSVTLTRSDLRTDGGHYKSLSQLEPGPTLLESTVDLIKTIKSELIPPSPPLIKEEDYLKENGIVPQFDRNSSILDDDETKMWVHLDWPVDDRLFTIENYKVLESILTVYPSANIRVWIAGPNDAYVHKLGNQISISHFEKYKKRGYAIEAQPVGNMNKGLFIGKEYWGKYGALCCFHCGPNCRKEDHIQPYHLLNFIRLNKLWRKGGIVSDFSFFFFGNLDRPTFRQGFHINSYCDYGDEIEDWAIEGKNKYKTKRCFTSTLLLFNEHKSESVLCVLKQYESKDFLNCIENDRDFEGSGCVLTAFTDCFESLGINNDLYVDSGIYSSSNSANKDDTFSTNIKRLDWYSNNKHKADLDPHAHTHPSPLEVFNGDPAFARSTIVDSTDWRLKRHVRVLWLGSLAFKGFWNRISRDEREDETFGSSGNKVISSKSLLAKAVNSIQLKPMNFNGVCSYIPDDHSYSTFDYTNSRFGEKIVENTCKHYSKRLSLLEDTTPFNTNMEDMACAPNIVIPGFMKSSQLKETHCYHGVPRKKLLHRTWCYPYVGEEDGFLEELSEDSKEIEKSKSQEESLFKTDNEIENENENEISSETLGEVEGELEAGHRMLSNLRGVVDYTPLALPNETGIFTSLHDVSTHTAAPTENFIEPAMWKKMIKGLKRGFSILDGTIYYGTDAEAARSLAEDNKNVKVIFVVRHPVDRIYSNYKFAFETYGKKGPFDNFTLAGTSRSEKFGQLRDMLLNGTDEKQVLNSYFNQSFPQGALGILFMHSIVYPSILHYQNVLGERNVLVLTSEDLEISKTDKINKLRKVQSTMNRVFSFLNLCPIKIPDSMTPVLEGRNKMPEDKDMSQDVYKKLNKFFAPFNDALARLVPSINISHWNTKPAPNYLRKYSYNTNTSLPEMWFENSLPPVASTGFGKLVSHLLPVNKNKNEEEDSSFNTTLGMLVSFR